MSYENSWARKCLNILFKLRERKSVGKYDNCLQIFGDWHENKQINLPKDWSLFFFFSFLLLPLCYPSFLARDHLSFILFSFSFFSGLLRAWGPMEGEDESHLLRDTSWITECRHGCYHKCCAKQWGCGGWETESRGDKLGVCLFVEVMWPRELMADICCGEQAAVRKVFLDLVMT